MKEENEEMKEEGKSTIEIPSIAIIVDRFFVTKVYNNNGSTITRISPPPSLSPFPCPTDQSKIISKGYSLTILNAKNWKRPSRHSEKRRKKKKEKNQPEEMVKINKT